RSSRSVSSCSHHLISTGPRMPAASPRRISFVSLSLSTGELIAPIRQGGAAVTGNHPRLQRRPRATEPSPFILASHAHGLCRLAVDYLDGLEKPRGVSG